jgi:pimeloyl-[acyl-carrier protein] methyl ester esterase
VSNTRAKLVLLPGMDGTGSLFTEFIEALPPSIETSVVRYPTDSVQSYAELLQLFESALPTSAPFVLFAESFSAPLAMQWAANGHPNLRGLVICAGFATSPVRGWFRPICSLLSPACFLVKPPTVAIKRLLVGREASPALVAAVKSAIRSVKPGVLSHRLRLTLTCDSRSALGKVKIPTLFIQAIQDRLVSPDCIEEMRTLRPEAAVERIGGPHLLLQARPKKLAEVISTFVLPLLVA